MASMRRGNPLGIQDAVTGAWYSHCAHIQFEDSRLTVENDLREKLSDFSELLCKIRRSICTDVRVLKEDWNEDELVNRRSGRQ